MAKRLLIVVNEDRFFLSHRREVAVAARDAGWEVTVVAKDTGVAQRIRDYGLHFIPLPINPTGMNPLQELATYHFLVKLYQRYRDAVVHHVGLKSILWGGLAARRAKVRGVLNAVSGLGTLFGEESRPKGISLLMLMLRHGMKSKNVKVIFQNHDDEGLWYAHRLATPSNSSFIKGSGVNLSLFRHDSDSASTKFRIIFTGRMLHDRGIYDIIEAAEILRPEFEESVEFLLCGPLTSNPRSLTAHQISTRCDGHYLKWLGPREDIPTLLQQASVMIFPSYYREGVPKSLLEASAAGLPIVTCDSIGCRDTVIEGLNGYKVPPRSPRALADRLRILITNPDLCRRMGEESRRIAERDYDISLVVKKHMHLYEELYNI